MKDRSALVCYPYIFIVFLIFAFAPAYLPAESNQFPNKKKWFYGGGIGASFGDVRYFEISPLIGYNIDPRASVGLSFLYRYRKDTRFELDQSTNDYGATLFGRYHVVPQFYLQAEYEYLSYEYFVLNNNTKRNNFGSFLAGGGFSAPVARNTSVFLTALYNFSYDQPDSPYAEPLTIRFGVGVGF